MKSHSIIILPILILSFLLWACQQRPSGQQKSSVYDQKFLTKSHELNLIDSDKRGIIDTSGTIYLVELDKQTLIAYKNEKILWKANIGERYQAPVIGTPEIRYIKLDHEKLFVVYGKHCYSSVDIISGSIKDGGCD